MADKFVITEKSSQAHFVEHATPKAILIWEETMPTLVARHITPVALPEEQISERSAATFSLVTRG